MDVRACESNLERARLVYGKEFADNLIEFSEALPDFKLSGMLGKPDFTKPNREYQLFFMNKRPIRSNMIGAALKEGLSATVQKDRQAVALLFMTLEPNTVDVNVHPAKIEVRFRNERTVFSGIVKMLRAVINKEKFIPKIETSVDRTPERTDTANVPDGNAHIDTQPGNKAHTITQEPTTPQTYPADRNVERKQTPLGEAKHTKKTESEPTHTQPKIDEGSKTDTQVPRTVMQPPQQSIPEGVKLKLLDFENVELKTNLFKTYIVAEGEDKVFFIDQHVAAERVLYERFVNQLKSDGIPVQGLLLPVTVEATPQQIAVFKVHGDIFEQLGFELEEFGGNTILIRAMPAPLPTRVAAQTITDILDKLPEQPHAEVALPKAIDDALITLACRAAVKAGDTLDAKEMINLVRELSEAKLPFNCPHSRPIIIEMERDELERRFHRQ